MKFIKHILPLLLAVLLQCAYANPFAEKTPPDGKKPAGNCDLVEYNGEKYIKVKAYTDPEFITALKLKYTGHSEIVGWIDDITNPELLNKLDKLPTTAYANLENDIRSVNALKSTFNENPELFETWEIVKDGSETLRRNTDNLEKLSRFMSETGMEKSKLISSFSNTKAPQKWIDMKIPKNELDDIFNNIDNSTIGSLESWTPQHKAQRWKNHKSANPDADFNTWSNRYDGNIKKVNSSQQGVQDYYNTLGWDCTNCIEVTTPDITILTENGPKTFARRHDIADIRDINSKKAIEVKEYSGGKVYYSENRIKKEVALDAKLLESDEFVSIEWVFKGCTPSTPLETALQEAGITILKTP